MESSGLSRFMKLMLFLLVCCAGTQGARNIFGSCPAVEPMSGFNMTRFTGLWYVIESFDSDVECMEYNISSSDNNEWRIQEIKQSGISRTYNGILFLKNPEDNPADLKVSWSINLGPSYPFTVYETDYNTYAGVFMCQKVWFYTRQNAVVLSRTPSMPVWLRQQTKGRLSKYNVEMSYYKRVEQSVCGRSDPEMTGISHTFDRMLFLKDAGDNSTILRLCLCHCRFTWGQLPFPAYDTDYDTYAGIFMCQKLWSYTRQNGVVLSRTPVMPMPLRQ